MSSSLLQPFVGFVPSSQFAHRVVGPPMSMLTDEQREAARLDPLSFRHVIGRGAGTSKEEADEWLRTCVADGVLDEVGPAVFVYRLSKGDLVATGFVVDVSIAAYDSGLVKRHEDTIASTERRMTDYYRDLCINGNPVALAHRPHPRVDTIVRAHTERDPDVAFVAADGYAHALWVVAGDEAEELCGLFADVLYITDGHHRLAAASRLAAEDGLSDLHVPCALFPSTELRLRAFSRCVDDPAADLEAIRDRLRREFQLLEVSEVEARPTGKHEFGVRLGKEFFRLHLDPQLIPAGVYESLDVKLLQELILEPFFGITNQRTDDRLKYLPDRPGVESRCDAWFLPFPPAVDDVLAVADAGLTMPPKSTWFAPKVPSGLVVRLLNR